MSKVPEGLLTGSMETKVPQPHESGTDIHDRAIEIWLVVRQSLALLLRHFVPFLLLASVVGWAVGMALFVTGLAPFLVVSRTSEFSVLYYRQIASVVFHAFSQVSVEAVIALSVWLELNGRRMTLRGSVMTAARTIPGVLRRPFYVFVSRVSAVAILRALLYLPQHAAAVLVLTSEFEPPTKGILLSLSFTGGVLNGLVDSRLLMLVPVAAIERTGVRDSFRRCWQLTAHHWVRILAIIVLVACGVAALKYSSTALLKSVAGYLRENDLTVLLSAAVLAAYAPVRAYWAIVATVCYRHIRVANGEIAPGEATGPSTA